MFKQSILALTVALVAGMSQLPAQTAPVKPDSNKKASDNQEQNRFWQASVGGGHYMVALDRISSISRHKYLLDGSIVVDEVTVDALGQSLARFYFLRPVSDELAGSGVGNVASRMVDRGRELVDKAATSANTNIQNMVIKKFPETTHAHCIEYRVESAEELTGLYSSVRTAWETGRGRSFTIK